MTEYNWNEKHIVTFPEEEVVLSTKNLHVYYGKKMNPLKGLICSFRKIKLQLLWDLRVLGNQPIFVA